MKQSILISLLIIIAAACPAESRVHYYLRDLSVKSDPCAIEPVVGYAINNLGDVCGHGIQLPSEGRAHPYFLSPRYNQYVNIGDMEGGFEGRNGGNGYGINDSGWVTGRNEDSAGHYHAFLWIDDNSNYVSDAGEIRDLADTDPWTSSTAYSVNSIGNVVGISNYYVDSERFSLGWIWMDLDGDLYPDDGEKIYLGDYLPTWVSDGGYVATNKDDRMYRWRDENGNRQMDPDEIVEIPNVVGGTKSSLAGVTSSGQIGGAMRNPYTMNQGFLWTDENGNNVAEPDEIVTFGHPLYHTHVRGMNDLGQIVGGTYIYQSFHGRDAYVWDSENGIQNLNEVIPDYGIDGLGPFYLSQAEGINREGQIVATGWFDDDENGKRGSQEVEHTILLTPVMAGDMDIDADVDLADFGLFLSYWANDSCLLQDDCDGADIDGSGSVDMIDLALFLEKWLTDISWVQ